MKRTPIQLSSLLLVIVIAIGLTLAGCESDPLLAPQAEVAEETGSYGNTNLPVSGTDNTKKAAKAGQNGKTGDNRDKRINPKLF